MRRMLYPTAGRPAPKRPEVTLTLASGQKIVAPLAVEDEWTISITDAAGERKTYEKTAVKYEVNDPMQAHFEQLGKYTDKDMHDVFAFLDSLK
jgi:cytochrome c oxidase cbb3-type subunit 3